MTLPKHHRSGVDPGQRSVAPPGPGRNPVITSSKMSRAPTRVAGRPQALQEPGRRRHQVHVGRHRLDDDAGHVARRARAPRCRGRPGCRPPPPSGTPAEPGRPSVATPLPAAGQQAVGVAVVAAVELHHPVAPGHPPGEPHGAHGRLGPRRDQPHLLAARAPARRCPRPAATSPGVGAPKVRPRAGRRRDRRRRPRGWAWPRSDGPVGLDEVDVAVALDVERRRRPRPGRRSRACRRPSANARTGELTPPGITAAGPRRTAPCSLPPSRPAASATDGVGHLGGEVGEDEVGPGPLDRAQLLERHRRRRRSSRARPPP